jgi:hypothetical protein
VKNPIGNSLYTTSTNVARRCIAKVYTDAIRPTRRSIFNVIQYAPSSEPDTETHHLDAPILSQPDTLSPHPRLSPSLSCQHKSTMSYLPASLTTMSVHGFDLNRSLGRSCFRKSTLVICSGLVVSLILNMHVTTILFLNFASVLVLQTCTHPVSMSIKPNHIKDGWGCGMSQ